MWDLLLENTHAPRELWQTAVSVNRGAFMCPHLELQRGVAAAGGQRGHGRVDQAVGQQGAAGVVE